MITLPALLERWVIHRIRASSVALLLRRGPQSLRTLDVRPFPFVFRILLR